MFTLTHLDTESGHYVLRPEVQQHPSSLETARPPRRVVSFNAAVAARAREGGTFPRVAKQRLDTLLAERGLFTSRSRAAASVMAGEVLIGTGRRRAQKPGEMVSADVPVSVAEPPRFVSRGGTKLENALRRTEIVVAGRRALDVGASTGGFTDCLLQRAAAAVIAVDVGYGDLHHRLRTDPRVRVLERTNARTLTPEVLAAASATTPLAQPPGLNEPSDEIAGFAWSPGPAGVGSSPTPLCDDYALPNLAVVDVSFISLTKVLPAVLGCLAAPYDVLALIKPQFEVGRERVGKGGVVRDSADAPRRADRRRARRGGNRKPTPVRFADRAPVRRTDRATARPARRPRLPLLRPPRAQGQPRDLHLAGRAGARWRRAQRAGDRAHRARGGALSVAGHSHIRGCPEGTNPKNGGSQGHVQERTGLPSPAQSVAVLTHTRTEDTREALHALIDRARAAGVTLRFDAEETRKHRLRAAPAVEIDALVGARRRAALHRARRRRHDPARAAALRGQLAYRCSRSTSARSASSPPSSPRRSRTVSPVRSAAASSCCAFPGSCSRPPAARRPRSTTSPSTAASASASPSSRTRSTARRSARCAATGSCWPPPPAPPATTSPTAAP